jgi:hypothetical protein
MNKLYASVVLHRILLFDLNVGKTYSVLKLVLCRFVANCVCKYEIISATEKLKPNVVKEC